MRIRALAALSVGLLAAACQNPSQPPAGTAAAPPTSSEQACTEYGFTPGTPAFDRCATHERAARAASRVGPDYSQERLSADARAACTSYGLQARTGHYDQCVNREVEARRYQGPSSS